MNKENGVLSGPITKEEIELLISNPKKFWEGVTKIDKRTFKGCISLKDITIPDSITSIGDGAFDDCDRLESITIPESVTSIGKSAFYGCKNLNSINIPDSITSIGEDAFSGCESLERITIPDSVTSIGDGAFFGCERLESITIPESVTSIDDYTFLNCKQLNSIIIPNSVTNIGYKAFVGCTSLTSVTIPNSVTSIGAMAFSSCSGLTSVTIPNSVTSIEYLAFCRCTSLTSVTIPNSVKSLGSRAFEMCTDLTRITMLMGISCGSDSVEWDKFKFIQFHEDGKNLSLLSSPPKNATNCIAASPDTMFKCVTSRNYGKNTIKQQKLNQELEKQGRKPLKLPDFMLDTFPHEQFNNIFYNNNITRWRNLVKTLEFDKLPDTKKNNSLTDLLKIYYAIGGFSEVQSDSISAYNYILEHVVSKEATSSANGDFIHKAFSKVQLEGPYNKDFAKFFMMYYDDPDFKRFNLKDEDDMFIDSKSFCWEAAHNSFGRIQKDFPGKVVSGTTGREDLLDPPFVMKHSIIVQYENVEPGNESLAELVGRYGYTQSQFEYIQTIYNYAKAHKDEYVIMADKANEDDPVKFRALAKDDPLGFVLGDITNCCQHIGGMAQSCVDDGYKNPNAGFIVFEESILDDNGLDTEEKRVLAQAYVWYDPDTKTVCYDNIEIPDKILAKLRKGDKHGSLISAKSLISAVEKSAESIILAMNRKGIEVELCDQ